MKVINSTLVYLVKLSILVLLVGLSVSIVTFGATVYYWDYTAFKVVCGLVFVVLAYLALLDWE